MWALGMSLRLCDAVDANLCSRGAKIMLNALNYANYALCPGCVIMPKELLA